MNLTNLKLQVPGLKSLVSREGPFLIPGTLFLLVGEHLKATVALKDKTRNPSCN